MSASLRVVFDTSVLVAAAHSRLGASFALIAAIPSSKFTFCLSVSLYLEWMDVLTRPTHISPGQTQADVLATLRSLAAHAHEQFIYFLWRPFLPDRDDDMILELAFASKCRYIITHNIRDFRGSELLGIKAITPRDFLHIIRQIPAP
jgi:putative PIN family toxin of toxin-antitoxin system